MEQPTLYQKAMLYDLLVKQKDTEMPPIKSIWPTENGFRHFKFENGSFDEFKGVYDFENCEK